MRRTLALDSGASVPAGTLGSAMTDLPPRPSAGATGLVVAALLATPLLAGATVVGAASPAAAHAGLLSSDPAPRADLETMPPEVRLTFNEAMNRPSYVTVTSPDGTVVAEGEGAVDGADVVQQVDDPGQAGTYRVDYRVISADGHPVEGALEFDVTTGDTVESGPVEQVTSSTWWWVALVSLPWLALGALLLQRRRSRTDA